jgi:mRNA-degrading endonuclease RelE of RelBE toxin-antitoxin system
VKWRVFFDPAAEKQFSKLGTATQRDIEKYLAKHLESEEDPRRFGKPFFQSRVHGATV